MVDPRKAAKKDWYAEDWFHEPTKLYTAYLKDAAFADPKKPVIAEWNDDLRLPERAQGLSAGAGR